MPCPRRLPCIGSISFSSAEMEGRYTRERAERLAKRLMPIVCCGIFLVLLRMCYAGLEAPLVERFRQNCTVLVLLALVGLWVQHRVSAEAFLRFYDFILFGACCVYLPLSISPGDMGQVWSPSTLDNLQNEVLITIQAIIFAHAVSSILELKWYYFAAFLHFIIVIQAAFVLLFGASMMPAVQRLQTILFTYFGFLVMIWASFGNEATRRELFAARVRLERDLEQDRELAKAERALALKDAEQAALLSFVRSVFDIFGRLVWNAVGDFEESRLHFAQEDNPALEELLQRPASQQPLDILLGPMPAVPGSSRDQWQEDRQRLWSYVQREVGESTGEMAEEEQPPQGQGLARKIAVTCRAAEMQAETIEIFVQRSPDGEVLFGILRGASCAAEVEATPSEIRQYKSALKQISSRSATESISSSASSASSNSSSSTADLWHLVSRDSKDVSFVIDAADSSSPIMRCSAEYHMLFSGPASLLIHPTHANNLYQAIRASIDRGKQGGRARVLLISNQLESWRITMDALCTYKVLPAHSDPGATPVAIRFADFGQPSLKRLKDRGLERPPEYQWKRKDQWKLAGACQQRVIEQL